MVGKKVSASRVVMTELVLPTHTNSLGSIFGGQVMSWIDICAAICAQRHSQSEVVTAAIDELNFIAPVYKGWVVNLKASINLVSKTSMEVGVRVDAENPKTGATFHTASAYVTFVALGSDGKPAGVPDLVLETEEEKRRNQAAIVRRQHRLARRRVR
ncbi:MAG: acyl-CoA thioesterase [Bdellovibrionota bacterium]